MKPEVLIQTTSQALEAVNKEVNTLKHLIIKSFKDDIKRIKTLFKRIF